MNEPTLRTAAPGDVDAIKTIAIESGLFPPDEVDFFDEILGGFFDGTLAMDRWLVVENGDVVVAAAYVAPEPFSDRLWNLYFLAVAPSEQGAEHGGTLVATIEQDLRAMGPDAARVLLVETSSTDQYARTRNFYTKQGFVEEARIRQFYGPDDDKVVFWKALVS